MSGVEAYLWSKGGKVWAHSREVELVILTWAGRCTTNASHTIKIKYTKEPKVIAEPQLAVKFHSVIKSG